MLLSIISIVLWGISQPQWIEADSTLYLKYEKQNSEIVRSRRGLPPNAYIYDFNMVYEGVDYKPITFIESDLSKIDTVSIEQIKSLDIKTHKWIKEYFLEFFNYFKGSKPFINEDGTARFFNIEKVDQVIIVELDREHNRALLHHVVHDKY